MTFDLITNEREGYEAFRQVRDELNMNTVKCGTPLVSPVELPRVYDLHFTLN